VASEVRKLLRKLGAHTLGEIVGDTRRLRVRHTENSAWIDSLFESAQPGSAAERKDIGNNSSSLTELLGREEPAEPSTPFRITNADRSVGARLSGDRVRRKEHTSSEDPIQEFEFQGIAGQSFAAFLVNGIHFQLSGEANDYVGKGLSGGTIAISAGA